MSLPKQYIFGFHAVFALLTKQPQDIVSLYIQKDRHDQQMLKLLQLAKSTPHIAIHKRNRAELDALCSHANHQGVIALRNQTRIYTEKDIPQLIANIKKGPPLILVLDGVQDPHNLGACFRSADAAGAHAIIVPKDKSVGMTPTVAKVASGAVETVPFVQVVNLARALLHLKDAGLWIYGADGQAETSLYNTNLTGPLALVMGAEGAGLRHLTKEHCDYLIKIPMRGQVASLNVSVATGIALFEVLRQRSFS